MVENQSQIFSLSNLQSETLFGYPTQRLDSETLVGDPSQRPWSETLLSRFSRNELVDALMKSDVSVSVISEGAEMSTAKDNSWRSDYPFI